MTRPNVLLAACAALVAGCHDLSTQPGPTSACVGGSVECGGACVRLETDGQHCGACGNACGAGRVCSMGACAVTCASPLAICTVSGADACADLRNDPANCGACGIHCPSGQACTSGTCAPVCGAPLVACGEGATASCADVRTDPANCGACGVTCPAGQVCSAGACAPTCAVPLVTCGEGSGAFCADLRTDVANCGACGVTCPAGQACVAGGCVATCAGAGGTVCGGLCVDLATDDGSCGACGHACAEGTACRDGVCVLTCPPPLVPCHGTCLDPRADVANCGACGNGCREGDVCREGACAAPACTGTIGLPARPLSPASNPDGVVYGSALVDLDGDGVPELVMAHYDGRSVEVRHLLPGGSFDAGTVTTLAGEPACLATGDVDGDGHLDVVVVLPRAGAVAVLRNAGDARFTVTTLPLGSFAGCAMGDLDGDGLPDLVLTAPSLDQVYVSRNAGNGAFDAPVAYAAGKPGPRYVALADMDHDGKLDVVVANDNHATAVAGAPPIDNGSVSIYRGNGDGTLGAPATFAAPEIPEALAVADMTGDGVLDVVVASFIDDRIGILPGDGAGGLLPYVATDGVSRPVDLAIGDLDGDGLPDLVVNRWWDDSLVLWNVGRGVLSLPVAYLGTGRFHVADVTRDGRADIVLASSRPQVLVQETGHGFGAASPSADGSGGEAVLLADMDGDGLLDLVSASGPAVRIGRGNGDGTFQPPVLVPATNISSGDGRHFAVGDLDGDGLPDLVYAGTYPYVRRNLGGLTFGPEVKLAGGYVSYGAIPDLIDIDGDGDLDVVLGSNSAWGSAQLLVFLNDGHGNLGTPTALDVPFAPESIAVGDVTGDGIPDLVISNHLSDEVIVLRGLGGGAFDPAFATLAVSYPSRPVIVDVTGDGKPDVVVGSWYPRWELRIYPGGQPGFATPIVIPVPVAPREILAVDVDSDGWKDLVVSGTGVAVLRALPGGGLAPPVVYEGGSRSGLAAADLDGDLRPDVVLGTDGDFTGYVVLRNRCLP